MQKLPYIKIYPGDELKMCGHLPLDVYGGYMKLRFKMWDSPERGKMKYDIKSIMRVMGADSVTHAQAIVNDLLNDKLLAVVDENGTQNIVDEEMVKDAMISKVRSTVGSTGGQVTQTKNKANRKQTSTKTEEFALANNQANQQQKREYEYEVDNEHKTVLEEEGGTGEEEPKAAAPNPEPGYDTLAIGPSAKDTIYPSSIVTNSDALFYFLHHPSCYIARDLLCSTKCFDIKDKDPARAASEFERLRSWGEAFNKSLASRLINHRALNQWTTHFPRFIGTQNLTADPTKIFTNEARPTNTRTAGSGHVPTGAIIPAGDTNFGKL